MWLLICFISVVMSLHSYNLSVRLHWYIIGIFLVWISIAFLTGGEDEDLLRILHIDMSSYGSRFTTTENSTPRWPFSAGVFYPELLPVSSMLTRTHHVRYILALVQDHPVTTLPGHALDKVLTLKWLTYLPNIKMNKNNHITVSDPTWTNSIG